MKYIKYTRAILAGVCLLTVAIFTSCKKDFFDIKDTNGYEVVGSFEDEGAVNLFLNRTYSLVMPQWPTVGGIHNTSDETNNANTAFLYGTLVENSVQDIGTAAGITTNRYSDIRRCNVGIDGLNTSVTLAESVKRSLKGQFFFLRAYTYFRMVRLYGGVPLVLHAQGVDDDNLNVPRSKTSECIAAIANDLDSAAAYLPVSWPASDLGRVTKAAALAVKGKALLYWASPQFNITNNSSRWADAYTANKAAYDTCIANGYSLFPTYANIFVSEDNKEVLLVRKYNTSAGQGTNTENITRPFSESNAGGGSNQPTWNLVQAYTMNNGLPISNAASGYSATQFWLGRDPRFNATIAYNGDAWPLSGKSTRKQWTYTGVPDESAGTIVTGFYCKRLCNPSVSAAQALYASGSGGGSGMDWIEMRFAEVILNLAECANETGNLTEAKNMVRLIRIRAGIVAGAFDYGLSVATDIPSMRSLILNERQIEFAMEGMRNFDLRRTRNLGLITNRLSYKVSVKPPYYPGVTRTGALATDIFLDKPDAFGVKPRDTVNINNLASYTKVFVTPVATVSLEGANAISLPDKYYIYALPNLFTQTPIIRQTNGWAGGTFDPYQ